MLRSTSVKQETWKPVKLLAKQPVKDKIISLECDVEGKIAVALTESSMNIFNERELLKIVELNHSRQLIISSSLENIFILTSESLQCFDYWGNQKWEYVTEGLVDNFVIDPNGKCIVLRGEKFVTFLNRFGDLDWDHNFTDSIISINYSNLGELFVATSKEIFLLTPENNFDKILDKSGQKGTFFSDSGGITIDDEKLTSSSLT